MSTPVRRAGAFAVVGSLALLVPLLDEAAAAPFAAIAALAAFTVEDGPVFELFARPGDHRDRRLYGLIGFALAASGLVLLSTVLEMPVGVGIAAILTVAYGNFATQAARTRIEDPAGQMAAFVLGGALGGAVGQAAALRPGGQALASVAPTVAFLAVSGALLAGLLRTILFESDDPHVMLSTGLWLWLLGELATAVTVTEVGIALALTAVLGYVSYTLETASVSGMLTGVSMGVVTVVLGGMGWFAVLIAFFGIGGLSTKFRYEKKRRRGVAEDDGGARSTANVLANGAVATLAVLGFAAADTRWVVGEVVLPAMPAARALFVFAFAGSLATAMSDTLSSEIGGAFDGVRLITSLDPVEPGTDGGITWQGELAGLAGAVVVAGIAVAVFEHVGVAGGVLVAVAGVVGMTADSVLGATVEGQYLDNSGVNLLATVAGAVVAAGGALALGVV